MVLDKRDKNGRTVVVAKLGIHDRNSTLNINCLMQFVQILGNVTPNTEFADASILDDMWMQVLLSDPLTQENGICAIADCKGLSTSILKWLVPRNCRVGAAKLESLPIKEWTVHVVNMGPILKTCIMLIKPFLKKATVAKVNIFHGQSGQSMLMDRCVFFFFSLFV